MSAPPAPAISCRGLKKHYGDVKAVDGLDLEVRRRGVLRPARPQRRRQDDDDRDPRGPDDSRRGRGHRARPPLGQPRAGAPRAARRLAPGEPADREAHGLRDAEPLPLLLRAGRDPRSSSWPTSRSRRSATPASASSRAASASGSPSPARSRATPRSCSSTSRRRASTRRAASSSGNGSRRYKAAGRTVLLTTHYMEEAERLCDRVAIVDHGRIIALGTPGRAHRPAPRAAHHRVRDGARGLADDPGEGARRRRAPPARTGAGCSRPPRSPRRCRPCSRRSTPRRKARLALDPPLDPRGRLHRADGTGAAR